MNNLALQLLEAAPGTRTCTACGEEKDISEFHKKRSGYQPKCKTCVSAHNREYAKTHKRPPKAGSDAVKRTNQKHYQANKEKIKAHNKQYRLDDPERQKRMHRAKYLRTREYRLAAAKQWKKDNPDKMRVIRRREAARRRSLLRAVDDGTVTESFLKGLYATTDCRYCKQFIPAIFRTADHVIPLGKGGLHSASNLVMSCFSCNSSKGNRTPEEWEGR